MKNRLANNHITDNNSDDKFFESNEKCIVNCELLHKINKTPISTFSITDMMLTFNDFK
jgi:hypothetical protein